MSNGSGHGFDSRQVHFYFFVFFQKFVFKHCPSLGFLFFKQKKGALMFELILSQIVLCAVNIYVAFTEKKRNIYVATFCFNACNLCMYLFNGDMATVITYICVTVRSLLYCFKDKFKTILVPSVCIIIQICLSAYSYENMWHLVPMCAAVWTCFYMWTFKSTQSLRIGNIINNALWMGYNIRSKLWIASLARAFTIAVNAYRYKKCLSSKGQQTKFMARHQ